MDDTDGWKPNITSDARLCGSSQHACQCCTLVYGSVLHLMMLSMMDLHGLGIDAGLQGCVIVGEFGKSKSHDTLGQLVD